MKRKNQSELRDGRLVKRLLQKINAMDNIDAEYEALCASFNLVSA